MKYKRDILAAIDFIEEHLTEPIDSRCVADSTHYSPYHFYKIFSLFVGMSIKEYIRRRRLTHAAYELSTTSDRIIDIAFTYCFESQESFTRSFKQVFGMTPKRYRMEKPYVEFLSKREDLDFDYLFQEKDRTPEIRTRPGFTVVGMEMVTDVLESPNRARNQMDIPEMWEVFLERKNEIKGQHTPHSYGVSFPHEDGLSFIYIACVEIAPGSTEVPDGMVRREIPEQTYAVFHHSDGVEKISSLLKYIYTKWEPSSGFVLKAFPEVEIYYDSRQEKIELCLPVVQG